MKVSIIGSGGIGGTIGTLWTKAGHEVFFSGRNPENLTNLVKEAGNAAQAGTVAQAAQFSDVIFLAVYYWTTDDAIAAAGSLDGKIIIDATNPYIRNDAEEIQRVPGVSSALELAQKLPQSKIVKAYNTLPTATFANEHHCSEPYALFYCGDDDEAKATVAQLIADSGFAGIDIGELSNVVHQEPGGKLYNTPLTVEAAHQLLTTLVN
jgi:8-hydroxy-5-deazaflavin:NADPH oxidoreductase